jgi:hypothetical protein
LFEAQKPHKQNNYQKPAQSVMCAHNLLKIESKERNSLEQKLLIVQIKRGCHQQYATLHDANIHVTTDHKYLDHREQNIAAATDSPVHCTVFISLTHITNQQHTEKYDGRIKGMYSNITYIVLVQSNPVITL